MRFRSAPALVALACASAPALAQNVLYDLSSSGHIEQSVASAGDVDGDGLPDLLVGNPDDDGLALNAGAVFVYSGRDGALVLKLLGVKQHEQMGYAVAGAGDVDADGFPDILGGAGQSSGSVARVWSGADGSQLQAPTAGTFDFFGNDVCALGDVDLDGFDDFAVSAPQDEAFHPGKGFVRAFSGASGGLLHAWTGDCLESEFGAAIDGPGDVDGDGLPDLAVYQPGYTCPQSVRVFSPLGGVLHTFPSGGTVLMHGYALSSADLDGDGVKDVLVGNPGDPTCTMPSAGSLRAYSGSTGAVVLALDGQPGCTSFGSAVDGVGDFDGDGREDVAVGIFQLERVEVYSSFDASLLRTLGPHDEHFGDGLAGLGDLNGDGSLEIGVVDTLGGAWVYSDCPGTVAKSGVGCEGSNDFIPKLQVTGCPNPGQTLLLRVSQGFGGQPAFLAFGSGQVAVPLGGGCSLFANPLLLVASIGTLSDFGPGLGHRDVPILVPTSVQGMSITIQEANIDPYVPMGFAVSNGVRVDVL